MKQLLLDIQPTPLPTLTNFVVGRNAEALHNLQLAASGNAEARFVYIWGATGSGKSHLLQACTALAQQQDVQLITLDNVHLLDNDAQIALFNTYNELRNGVHERSALLVSGIAAPTQMQLRDDLATRLAWGLVYQIHPLSDMEKAHALKAHAAERGIKLGDDVIAYCLRHLRRDLPNLMATLDALDKWSLTMKKPVTVPLLRQLLQFSLDFYHEP
ncbi:MAG: DnaA regulatory inactivator Hda [Methylophilaceae bacterium]|nr:DnaA regulatory inactivator Hda [Methylophilaceae bacterium]NOT68584.1 DnaA regulatory inactivator Hda [Methylophilaceae bacterium]